MKCIHRIISFEQKAWLKPYIEFNTKMRQEAKNDFEVALYKAYNNIVFGYVYRTLSFFNHQTFYMHSDSYIFFKIIIIFLLQENNGKHSQQIKFQSRSYQKTTSEA